MLGTPNAGGKLQQLRPGRDAYSLTSIMGAIPAEIFESRHYGTGMVAAILGGAAGPWVAGVPYDAAGSYSAAFWIGRRAASYRC